MKGSITKRGERYYLIYDLERGPDGKRRQVRRRLDATSRRAAEAEARAMLGRIDGGEDVLPSSVTVAAFSVRWLAHMASRLRPTTHHRYDALLRLHVLPVVGGVRLHKLRPGHVQGVLDGATGKGLAPATVVQVKAVLSRMLASALEWGMLAVNPATAIRRPKVDRPKLVTPTTEQVRAVVQAATGTVWELPLVLAIYTGARRSEVLGLAWSDVSLDAERVSISRSLQVLPGGEVVYLPPKSERSRRTFALASTVVEALRRQRRDQAERRLALGSTWRDTGLGLVVDRGDGAPLLPDAFSGAWKRFAARAGLPSAVRLHDARHAVATQLLRSGVALPVVSAMLGHSSTAFTADVYQRVDHGMTKQAADAMERALGGA